MADVVNPQIVDSVTMGNAKTIAEAGSFAVATLMQEMAASAGRRAQLGDAAMGAMLRRLSEPDVQEGAGETLSAHAVLPNALADLSAAISAIQQLVKTAQTTPPSTAS